MSGQTGGVATLLDDGSWEIQGRHVRFPVRITDAAAACAVYPVRAARAARLVAGTGLELVTVAGRTPLFLLFVDYKVNDLGDYDEVGVAFLVRHPGRTGLYVHQLPVTQTFTLEAGRALWGLPKWLARAELSINGRDATCRLADDTGRHVLTAALRALPLRLPVTLPVAGAALAPVADAVLASRVRARARGVRVAPGGARLVLGSGHPMADELRALDLPRRPLLTAIVEHLAFDMGPADRLPRPHP
jgi:Acetoacetate decarboxylase (ADC)